MSSIGIALMLPGHSSFRCLVTELGFVLHAIQFIAKYSNVQKKKKKKKKKKITLSF
jgi:hypothetical protein